MTRLRSTARIAVGVAAVLVAASAVALAATGGGGRAERSLAHRIEALVSSPRFAGGYSGATARRGGGVNVYGTARGIPAMRRAILRHFGRRGLDATSFVLVLHPYAELAALARRIARDRPDLAAAGVDVIRAKPGVASNRVVVAVRSSPAAADRVLGERYPSEPLSVKSGTGPAVPVGQVYAVDIQKLLTLRRNPFVGANFSPDGSLATARWWICPPPDTTVCARTRHRGVLSPGRSRAGTVFQAVARFRGQRYVGRTPPWGGTVHATSRPSVAGDARVGGTVAPVPGRWRGGWPGDYSFHRIEACRTPDARRCVTVMDTDPMHPGPHRRVVVRARYAGWYLFALDQRFSHDTAFAEPGYGRPEALPPLRTSGTVVRSAPGLRVRAA